MSLEQIDKAFELQKNYKYTLKNSSSAYRIGKLQLMKNKILELQSEIEQAMVDDFGKSKLESDLTEILPVIAMINQYSKKLKSWMKPKKVCGSLLFFGTKSYVSYEAKGNCLIISPWNYPFQLSIYPILTAFSAGNTVIIKPSEYTPATNKVLGKLISLVFKPEEVTMIEGEVEASTALLDKPFDHIFFTGSTPVGKIVMEKASKHLASVSLELGGKSPVFIDNRFPIDEAAKNIAWGKFVNSGQTCVAPDYILLPKGKVSEFVKHFKESLTAMYGEDIGNNDDFCRIITERHGKRQKSLVDDAVSKGAKVELGGEYLENGKMLPTVLSNVTLDMEVMKDEIFGSVLPVVEYDSLEGAVDFINDFDNSLALYVFSYTKDVTEYVRKNTNSGGYSINETLLHVGHSNLPFGGAGKSGLGKYHGHYGFEELSNMRSVLHRKFKSGTEYFYPPYDSTKKSLTDKILKFFNRFL